MREDDFVSTEREEKSAGRSMVRNVRRSVIKKRSVILYGRKTSVSVEDPFWEGLAEIAALDDTTLALTIERIGGRGEVANLSSRIRTTVLAYYRDQSRTQ